MSINFGFDISEEIQDTTQDISSFFNEFLGNKANLLGRKLKGNDTDSESDSDDDDDDTKKAGNNAGIMSPPASTKKQQDLVNTKSNNKGELKEQDDVGLLGVTRQAKRRIKVLIVEKRPDVYKKKGAREYTGIVYDIWKAIKLKLQDKYEFDETFIKTYNFTKQIKRVQLGEFDMAVVALTTNYKRSRMVSFTRPIYINQQSILTYEDQSYISYFFKVAVQLFLPPLILLLILGIVFGIWLYHAEPERGFKRSLYSSIASMFGEMGFVSENSSLRMYGMIVAFIIMTVSYYFTIFLQAATTEKLIQFRRAQEITVDNLHEKRLLYPKGSGYGRAFKSLGANVKSVNTTSVEELKKKIIAEKGQWDGIAIPFMTGYMYQDENFKLNKTNFGLNEQAFAVKMDETVLLRDLNVAITRLQDTYEIKRIYNYYYGDEYDYMGVL